MKCHEIKAYARKLRNNPTASEKDAQRQSILENAGFEVIRHQNHELSDIEKVLKQISSHFSE